MKGLFKSSKGILKMDKDYHHISKEMSLDSLIDAKTDRDSLKRIKIRPLSFLIGIGMGIFDAKIPEQGEGLNKLISKDPSLLQYALFGGILSYIIYLDNIKGGRTKDNSKYNAKICFGNYTVGYALGYTFSKLL